MIIDLHVHTREESYDSTIDIPELVKKAKRAGIDGVCITDHDRFWSRDALVRLSEAHDFLLLPGVEVGTNEGHVLVFGLEKFFFGMWYSENLKRALDEAEGAAIMSHPYRRHAWGEGLDEFVERYRQNPGYNFVDAIEALNGRSNEKENAFSTELCRRLDVKGVGGSDAHDLSDVPSCATHFEKEITCVEGLIREIKAGRFEAVDLRVGKSSSIS